MSEPVSCIGHAFSGRCDRCGTDVTGTITTGSDFVSIEGTPVARVGDTCTATCGHTGRISTGSEVLFIEDIPVARVGDSISGDITGTITEGYTFFTSE